MRILIAEDDAISCLALTESLRKLGHDICRHGQRQGYMGSIPERKPSAPHFRLDDALHRWVGALSE
jgi:hypothetical protein